MGNGACACASGQVENGRVKQKRTSLSLASGRDLRLDQSEISNNPDLDTPPPKYQTMLDAVNSNTKTRESLKSFDNKQGSPDKSPTLILSRGSSHKRESIISKVQQRRTENRASKVLQTIQLNPSRLFQESILSQADSIQGITQCQFYLHGSLLLEKDGEKQVLVHSKIRQMLKEQDTSAEVCTNKIKQNQIVFNNRNQLDTEKIDSPEQIIKFMNSNSKKFKNIKGLEIIDESLNCVIYSIKSMVNLDLVLKVPKVAGPNSFHDLVFETQMIKALSDSSTSYLTQVREELFQVDPANQKVLNYAVVIEKPRHQLFDFLDTPLIEDDISAQLQFSQEKYLYFFYQAVNILAFLEQQGIYYGQFSPLSLMISNDYQLKIGDFLIATIANKFQKDGSYSLRAMNYRMAAESSSHSPESTKDTKRQFFEKQWSLADLHQEDRKCIADSFIIPNFEGRFTNQPLATFVMDQLKLLNAGASLPLVTIIDNFKKFIHANIQLMINLLDQFEQEGGEDATLRVADIMLSVGKELGNKMAVAYSSVVLGEALIPKKQYAEATRLLSESVEISELNSAYLSQIYLSRAFRALAVLEREQGNIQIALEYFELTIDASSDKRQHLKYYQEISKTLMDQEKYNQALECNLKALQLAKETKGNGDYITLECYINLADNYEKLGRNEESEETFELCLAILEKQQELEMRRSGTLVVDRPSLVHRIAISMRQKQEFEKAVTLLQKVIRIKTRLLGTELHQDIAFLYNDLALTYQGLEQFQDAIESMQKNIEILKSMGNSQSQVLVSAYSYLAEILRDLGDLDEAVNTMQCALAVELEISKQEPTIDCSYIYKALAEDYLRLGDASECLDYISNALDIEIQFYGGRENLQVQETLIFMAEAYQFAQSFENSIALLDELIKAREKQECDASLVIPLYRMQAINYQSIQQYDKAIENLKVIIALQSEIIDGVEQQPMVLSLYTKIAGNYRLKGDLINAIAYSVKVYELMTRMYGKVNDQTNLAFKNVGIMYMENQDWGKAHVIFKKYLQRMEEIYGLDYARIQDNYIRVEELVEECSKHEGDMETV